MKTLSQTFSVLLIILIFHTSSAISQNISDDAKPVTFGIGIHSAPFLFVNFCYDDFSPAYKMMVTTNISNKWRLEPVLSFNIQNDKEEDEQEYGVLLGLGTFWMFQKEQTNFYLGLRMEYFYLYKEYNYLVNTSDRKDFGNRYSFGPFAGAEYFLGRHFSLGIETGLKYATFKLTQKPENNYSAHETSLSNESGITLRFYF